MDDLYIKMIVDDLLVGDVGKRGNVMNHIILLECIRWGHYIHICLKQLSVFMNKIAKVRS